MCKRYTCIIEHSITVRELLFFIKNNLCFPFACNIFLTNKWFEKLKNERLQYTCAISIITIHVLPSLS